MKPKVFISATTGDLGSIRARVKEALLTLECTAVEQTNFPPDYRSVAEILRTRISDCHVMVHIAGLRYGSEPQFRDPKEPRRSYTQMEYHIARDLRKPIYTFVCGKDFPFDPCEPEEPEKRALQDAHRKQLLGGTIHFEQIPKKEDLDRKVREIDYKKHVRKTLWTHAGVTAAALLVIAVIVVWAVRSLVGTELDADKGERLLLAKDYAGAFHAFSKASDAAPRKVEFHRKIEECARRGKLGSAFLERYRALVEKNPQSAILHNYLGNAYLLLDPEDKDGEGAKQYQTALRIDTNFAPPLINLGILASRHGDFENAESLFLRYLQAEPDDAVGWINLGILYLNRADKSTEQKAEILGKAEQSLNRALSREPASAGAWNQLGHSRTNSRHSVSHRWAEQKLM